MQRERERVTINKLSPLNFSLDFTLPLSPSLVHNGDTDTYKARLGHTLTHTSQYMLLLFVTTQAQSQPAPLVFKVALSRSRDLTPAALKCFSTPALHSTFYVVDSRERERERERVESKEWRVKCTLQFLSIYYLIEKLYSFISFFLFIIHTNK